MGLESDSWGWSVTSYVQYWSFRKQYSCCKWDCSRLGSFRERQQASSILWWSTV